MNSTPPTHEQVVAALAPTCALSTLEALVKLAGMTAARPGVVVPHRFFWCSPDVLWLKSRGLIEGGGNAWQITSKGVAIVHQLKVTLNTLCA